MRPSAAGGDEPGTTRPGRAAGGSGVPRRTSRAQRVTPDLVLAELRAHDFAVLSTADGAGRPHAAGVTYGVSPPGRALALYVMTRRHLRKARDAAHNPRVALVVPLPRRLLWFVPPATIQLRGRAELLDWTDPEGTEVFRRSWLGRRILAAYAQSRRRARPGCASSRSRPTRSCTRTGLGSASGNSGGAWSSAAGSVLLPTGRRASRAAVPDAAPPPG